MKKILQFMMLACLFLVFTPMHLNAQTTSDDETVPTATIENAEASNAKILLARLYEIKDMDKSNLTPSDKKDLRNEVRGIKSGLKKDSGGIYLSVGAIIVILLLLILVLR